MSKLADISKIIMGQSPPSETYNDDGMGLPFFQGKTDFGFVYPTVRKFCSEPKKTAEPNDILISVRAPVGPVNICQEKSCIGRGLAAIRAKSIFQKFLYFYFIHKEDYIASLGTGSTFHAINKNQLENLDVSSPPLPEQRKIAHVLSTIQAAIEKQRQIIERTTELKKALMHKLFTEGLRGEKQKQTEIGPVPQSWDVVELGKYAKILNGFAFKSEDYVKKGARLVRISNVSLGFFSEKDTAYLPNDYIEKFNNFALNEGDLTLALTRPIIKEGMKYCFIEKRHLPALLNQRVGKFKIVDSKLTKQYLYHIVFSKYFVDELKKMAEGSNQPNVSPTKLEKFLIPIPRYTKEQLEISTLLSSLNKKISNLKNKIERLNELFKSMLQQLMTGQTRVHELEFENIPKK